MAHSAMVIRALLFNLAVRPPIVCQLGKRSVRVLGTMRREIPDNSCSMQHLSSQLDNDYYDHVA